MTMNYICTECGVTFQAQAFFGHNKCNACRQIEAINKQGELNREFQSKQLKLYSPSQYDHHAISDDTSGPETIEEEFEALENTHRQFIEANKIKIDPSEKIIEVLLSSLIWIGPIITIFFLYYLGVSGFASLIIGVIAGWLYSGCLSIWRKNKLFK